MRAWVADEYSKINPHNGCVLECDTEEYAQCENVDSGSIASQNQLNFVAARNESIAFQLVLPTSKIKNKKIKIEFKLDKLFTIKIYREWYIRIGKAWFPDPLIPFSNGKLEKWDTPDNKVIDQNWQAFWLDAYIPDNLKPAVYNGSCQVYCEAELLLELKVAVKVIPITLPERPTFTLEYNNFGSIHTSTGVRTREENMAIQNSAVYDASMANHHKLAREHWGNINILGYGQNGLYAQKMVPILDDKYKITSFKDYDKRFGPYLDGSAFEEGYGKGVPVSDFYLPFSYTWPAPYHFFPSETYQNLITDGVKSFEKHLKEKKWNKTNFHLMLNHKSRRSIFPYNGDEPTRVKDYGMLKYYGEAANKGKSKGSKIKLRLDVGHFECTHIMDECDWLPGEKVCTHSSALNGLSDFWVTSYCHGTEEKLKRRDSKGETMWIYMGSSLVSRPLSDMGQILLEAYRRKAKGYCFWSCNSWHENPWEDSGIRLGFDYLFYPGGAVGHDLPLPSLRLKAARRAAIDIEYLQIAAKKGNKGKTFLSRFVSNFDSTKIEFMDDKTVKGGTKIDFLKNYSWQKLRKDLLSLVTTSNGEKG